MKNVLSEVHAVVLAMGEEWKNRIPTDVWNDICAKKNDNYCPFIDENKSLVEQNISNETITFIAMLHRDYWCDSEEERASLIAIFDKNQEEWEKKLSQATGTRDLLKMVRKQ